MERLFVKQEYRLDPIDLRIVNALQQDGALSHAELGERVGTSAASCWRRIKALEAAGILTATVRLVDPHKIGRGVNVFCNVRVRHHAQEGRRPFEEFVRARPEVVECFSMSGEWDYLLRIVVADVADYESFLMHTLLEHPAVGAASSHFALSTTKYTTALPLG